MASCRRACTSGVRVEPLPRTPAVRFTPEKLREYGMSWKGMSGECSFTFKRRERPPTVDFAQRMERMAGLDCLPGSPLEIGHSNRQHGLAVPATGY